MRSSCQFHWCLTLQPQGVEHIDKVTDRPGHSSRLCPISAEPIASQIVKNGAHKEKDRESRSLVNKKASDLWKVLTSEGGCISGPFMPKVLANALRAT